MDPADPEAEEVVPEVGLVPLDRLQGGVVARVAVPADADEGDGGVDGGVDAHEVGDLGFADLGPVLKTKYTKSIVFLHRGPQKCKISCLI